MHRVRPAIVVIALAALAVGGCADIPSAAHPPDKVSCWNVSTADSPRKTYCRTQQQWAQFLAAANIQCREGPAVNGLCPEHWKERERVQRGQHGSWHRESDLSQASDRSAPQYVMPYLPMMPDGFVPLTPATSQ